MTDVGELTALLGEAPSFVRAKLGDRLDDPTRAFVALSPLLFVATTDDEGCLDISPKGDEPGFVQVADETTLLI
ncbi:MAG: pyridoxamine 5'-phosphate oxidase family protein, partial [Acidimicrobiia bacterium]|nr:pyridoxamine 5'-phosphate oxidase family protein [Acidimicrobiia bacterium]